jgi:TRAP-type uncharacterized transport system fused permease subunit
MIQLLPAQLAAGCALLAGIVTYMIGGLFSPPGSKGRIKALGAALADGTVSALATLMIMSVCVQMAVSLVSLTGLAVKMSETIMGLAGVNILLALIATMVIIMILGMGMPTTAAYIIGAAVLGSTLIGMGIKGIASHMFIFYYSVLGNISPPVCVAVYTAVTIAGGNWLRMAWIAMSLCLGAYLIPFTFVLFPALLMEGSPPEILYTTLTACLGVVCISAGVFGFFKGPAKIWERILFIAGGFLLFVPGVFTDSLGALLAVLGLFSQWIRGRSKVTVIDRVKG